VWAQEEAERLAYPFKDFPPKNRRWDGGYKQRNLKIADASNVLLCIAVARYHPGFKGPRYGHCYHCGLRNPPHIKSGGCWTMWKAATLGKTPILEIVEP
jgi:hypothetical protein